MCFLSGSMAISREISFEKGFDVVEDRVSINISLVNESPAKSETRLTFRGNTHPPLLPQHDRSGNTRVLEVVGGEE